MTHKYTIVQVSGTWGIQWQDERGNNDGEPCMYAGATEDEVMKEAEYIIALVSLVIEEHLHET